MSGRELVHEPLINSLIERARALIAPGERRVLGIAGPPGAGKSTLAEAVCAALGAATAALMPMDGFHLSNDELVRIGMRDRKGAPETFDAERYIATLARLRASHDQTVCVPSFDREAEAVIPDASATCTRNVGLPLESRISRARTDAMLRVMPASLAIR